MENWLHVHAVTRRLNLFILFVGHYLFIEASMPAKAGQKARLISKTFSGSNNSICFIFSYNMYGSGMGSLNIYLKSSEGKQLVFSKVGDQGQSWHTVHLDLQRSRDYSVRYD